MVPGMRLSRHLQSGLCISLLKRQRGHLLPKRPPPLLLSFTAVVHHVLTPPPHVSITWERFRNANSPAAPDPLDQILWQGLTSHLGN